MIFCSQCGREIAESSNYCSLCGAHQRTAASFKRLTLSASDSKLAGVCGGIADYMGVDATIVRLIWLILSVFPGGIVGGVVAYLVAWIVIPKAGMRSSSVASPARPSANA